MTVTITRTQRRFVLPEADLPTHYVNIAADLPEPLPPPLHPGTREPIGPEMLAPLFPMELIRQEVSTDPLHRDPRARCARRTGSTGPRRSIRATALEKALDTPARIYYKYEGVSPAGSHKPNTAIAQAFYNQRGGHHAGSSPRPAPGSGGARSRSPAASSGSRRRSSWCKVSYEQKPYRRSFIETFGGTVIAVAVDRDERRARRARRGSRLDRQPRDRDQRGRRGGRQPRGHEVLARQRPQPRAAAPDGHRPGGDRSRWRWPARCPDVVIGCAGGGSNFCRHRVPVPARQAGRAIEDPVPGGRAGVVPEPDQGRVPIRLRRHRPA